LLLVFLYIGGEACYRFQVAPYLGAGAAIVAEDLTMARIGKVPLEILSMRTELKSSETLTDRESPARVNFLKIHKWRIFFAPILNSLLFMLSYA
jgi:hypothetical protein